MTSETLVTGIRKALELREQPAFAPTGVDGT